MSTARQQYEQALDAALVLLKQWEAEDLELIESNDRLIAALRKGDELTKRTRPEARGVVSHE